MYYILVFFYHIPAMVFKNQKKKKMFDPDKCVISKSSCEVIILQSLLDIYIQRTKK